VNKSNILLLKEMPMVSII